MGIALAMMIRAAISLAAAMLSAVPTQAEPVADFYRGKTLRMLIGYGPGGGYDIYGRLVAEFLPRHLPGKPTIIAQNMPGAGSFAAASYIQDVAPKDGTVFGSLAQTLALDSMTNTSAKVDVAKMPYIGRKDPEFLAACETRHLMVDGAAGEEIDEIVRATLQLPKAVAEKIGQ